MKIALRYIISLLIILLFIVVESRKACAQKIDAFASVSVSPREGVVRQPYKVTIKVHSSTWFAKPLQFTNLRIDDAFIIPFTRTVSSIDYIKNKKYATLSFYYLVFPYNTGNLEIPGLELSTSIPPEGGSKGEPVTIRTKPQNIKVTPIPSSTEEKVWMVAKNVSVRESWNKDLQNLKVGDVVEREIVISVEGTLPSLILPLEVEAPENVSIYPAEAELQDKRNDRDINGVRIEKYSYLLEKEGKLIIPEQIIRWWNPVTKKAYQRTLQEQKLNVAANTDMTMMKSLKDSLLAMSAPVVVETEEKTIPWLQIGFILIVLLFAGYFGTKTFRKISHSVKTKRVAYLQSEAYYFKQVTQALNHKNTNEFIRLLYVWFDKARKPWQNAAIYYFLNSEEKGLLESVFRNKETKLSAEQHNNLSFLMQNLRKRILLIEKDNSKLFKLNPV